MKVKITNDKPNCSTCLYATKGGLFEGFFCDKKNNIISADDFSCRKYKVAINKVAEKRQHTQNFDRLGFDKLDTAL